MGRRACTPPTAEDFDGDGRKELLIQSAQVEFVSSVNPRRPEGEANSGPHSVLATSMTLA